MRQLISYETLGSLDGGMAQTNIDKAIRAAVFDLEDRGADEKPRVVTITLTMKRVGDQVDCEVQAIPKIPSFKTAATAAEIKYEHGEPSLFFNDLAPDDPAQQTIDDAG